jgi:hypothetical protein
MTKKLNSLTTLFIITLLMVVMMLVTIYRADEDKDDYGLLFPELFDSLSEVDTVRFNSSEDQFTLKRDDEDWFIVEHHGYLANFDEVKRMLIDVAEAEIIEAKTDNVDDYYILGVEGAEPFEPGGSSVQIDFISGDDVVAGLVLGQQRQINTQAGPAQFYVRRAGESESWLAEGYLQLSPVMLNWIQAEIIDIARERIARVEITQPDGSAVELINLGVKDKFGTPEARENTMFKYQQLGYDIAGSLHQMRMEDVSPVNEFSRGEADEVTARFTTFDGLVVTAKTSFMDGFYFSTFSTAYDASVIQPAPKAIQEADVLLSEADVQAEVAKLNKRLAPWVYKVSGFVGTNLMRAKGDVVVQSNNVIPMPADMTGFGR